jgi:hypothetical protein
MGLHSAAIYFYKDGYEAEYDLNKNKLVSIRKVIIMHGKEKIKPPQASFIFSLPCIK